MHPASNFNSTEVIDGMYVNLSLCVCVCMSVFESVFVCECGEREMD